MAHVTKNRVAEKVTAPGSSAFTLPGSAITAHRTFASVMATGDTCFYIAKGVDSNLNDTGAWECGLGTYSATNTLTRTTVYESTNGNAAVNFSSGDVIIALSALAQSFQHVPTTKLAADSTNSTVTLADVTGLSFSAEASAVYIVEFYGVFQTAATTTGIALGLTVPTGATVVGQLSHPTSATAIGGTFQTTSGATAGATTGVTTANSNTPIWAGWIVATSTTAGTVQLQMRSEVAASAATLKAGLCILKARREA